MGKIRTKMYSNLANLNLGAELNPVLKVLAKSAAPGMIGVAAVTDIIGYTVDCITLKEAGVFTGNEVCNRVRKYFGTLCIS